VVVVDGQGGVLGKLGRDSLIYDQDAIESAMQTDVLTLMPDTTLDVALAQVRAHPGASVYLVEDDIRRRPTGAIDNEELMRAYQRVLDRVYAEEYGDAAASR
jgi:Mg/Co/Ni transporter MgtE